MSKTIQQFGYKIIKMQKKDDRLFSPIVILNLKHWTGSEDDTPQISAHLMSEGEIDERIAALKADLDAVGKRAKTALVKAKAETRKIAAERRLS